MIYSPENLLPSDDQLQVIPIPEAPDRRGKSPVSYPEVDGVTMTLSGIDKLSQLAHRRVQIEFSPGKHSSLTPN
jgi:hypothetical protein